MPERVAPGGPEADADADGTAAAGVPDVAARERELHLLNEAIGAAESTADRGFFEEVLHPAFVMIRPSGAVATRAEFLAGLAADAHRRTGDIAVSVVGERRAVVRCTVIKWSGAPDAPPADAPRYDNLRLFWREEAGWRLVAWVNEPAR